MNHKQLFQSRLGCVRLGNLKMLGRRRRGGVPAGPRQRLRPAQKSRHPRKTPPSPPGLRGVAHTRVAISPPHWAVAILEVRRARGIPTSPGLPAKAAEGPGLPSPGASSAAQHRWRGGTRPEGFPSKDQRSRSSRCPLAMPPQEATLPDGPGSQGSGVLREPQPQLSCPPWASAIPATKHGRQPARRGASEAWQHLGTTAECSALEPRA